MASQTEGINQDRRYTYKRNTGARSRNHSCRGKAIRITYSECVYVALVIQHAMRMRRMIFSSVDCPACYIFAQYLINGTILHIKCVSILSTTSFSETFLILRRNERDIIINVLRSCCKVPVIRVRFQ